MTLVANCRESLKVCTTNLTIKLECQNGLSEMFSQKCGVMQGERVSPTLFAIIINEIEAIMNNIPSMGVFVGNHKISVLKYADYFQLRVTVCNLDRMHCMDFV